MTGERFTGIPEQWPEPEADLLDAARSAVWASLQSPMAVERLTTYFDPGGNYAGGTFLDVGPIDPYDLTASDFLAITTLNVTAPPASLRRLLQPSRERTAVVGLLGSHSLPVDAALEMADAPTLQAMEDLHRVLKRQLSSPDSKQKNPWVTTSKLCARKRPELFPVRDHVVCTHLGLGRDFRLDWQVFRHLIQDPDIRGRIDQVADDAAATCSDVRHAPRLRQLDVLLWMHVTEATVS